MARTTFTLIMIGAAAGVALLLGAIGIYGVISYTVSLRTREIGVRMALGARSDQVRRMVVRQGLVLAGIGAAIGLVGALGMSRLISSLLYGIAPYDPADARRRNVRPAGGSGGGELAARHARGAHRSDRGVAIGRLNRREPGEAETGDGSGGDREIGTLGMLTS